MRLFQSPIAVCIYIELKFLFKKYTKAKCYITNIFNIQRNSSKILCPLDFLVSRIALSLLRYNFSFRYWVNPDSVVREFELISNWSSFENTTTPVRTTYTFSGMYRALTRFARVLQFSWTPFRVPRLSKLLRSTTIISSTYDDWGFELYGPPMTLDLLGYVNMKMIFYYQ